MSDDRVDVALRAAGRRLRARQPDAAAARRCLDSVLSRELTEPPPLRRVRRTPLLFAGLGLAAAAVIAVLVVGTGNEQRTIEQVPATQPDRPPAPTVEATVPDPEPSAASTLPATVPPTVGRPACEGVDVPAGDVILACRESTDAPAAIVQRAGDTPSYYATGTGFTGGAVELEPIEVPGVAGAGFVADVATAGGVAPDSRCLVVLLAGSEGWSEACGPLAPATPASFVGLRDELLVQIDVDEAGVPIHSRDLSEGVWPASGCDIANATQITTRIAEELPGALIGGLRCDGDATNLDPDSDATAVASVGSTFLQGPMPDGSIVTLARRSGAWTITNTGTGIDAFAWPIPPATSWPSWPGDTAPAGGPDALGPLPGDATLDLDEMAGRAATAIAEAAPADGPPDSVEVVDTLVVEARGLLVLQATHGGDDSVGGTVYFVWLGPVFDAGEQVGWDVAGVYRSQLCLRAGSLASPACL